MAVDVRAIARVLASGLAWMVGSACTAAAAFRRSAPARGRLEDDDEDAWMPTVERRGQVEVTVDTTSRAIETRWSGELGEADLQALHEQLAG